MNQRTETAGLQGESREQALRKAGQPSGGKFKET